MMKLLVALSGLCLFSVAAEEAASAAEAPASGVLSQVHIVASSMLCPSRSAQVSQLSDQELVEELCGAQPSLKLCGLQAVIDEAFDELRRLLPENYEEEEEELAPAKRKSPFLRFGKRKSPFLR